MNSEEIGGYVIVACYSTMLVVALKLLGIRRVLLFLVALVLIGCTLALRALATVASSRR